MKKLACNLIILAAALAAAPPVLAHCEIPCGIYGDEARILLLAEHITTIEKSMKAVAELSVAGEVNSNQLIRWISNKEAHADKIQQIVTQYFLTQRIKPKDPIHSEAHEKYLRQLTLLHKMLLQAMKSKQTTDQVHVENLRGLLHQFSLSYLGKKTDLKLR